MFSENVLLSSKNINIVIIDEVGLFEFENRGWVNNI